MKYWRFWVLLTLFFSCSLEAQPLSGNVSAQAAILFNPKNGAILYEKRAKEPHYPASITKIATALYVLDAKNFDLETGFRVNGGVLEIVDGGKKQASPLEYPAHVLEHDGVLLGLKEGEVMSLNALLHSLMLVSSNDVANVIAENSSGSVEAFMKELNIYLREKGIHDTCFQNPHGLHHPAHLTTAYDMARIAALAFDLPRFREISSALTFDCEGYDQIVNTNHFLKRDGKFYYPKVIGGKTGYTAKAGYNLVVAAEDKGRRLIAVLLGCKTREDRYKDAIALFETAFRERPLERIVLSCADEGYTHQLEKAKTPLRARLREDVRLRYYPSEEVKVMAKIVWHSLKLPIQKGACVAEVYVEDERGNQSASAPLFATSRVEKLTSYKWVDLLKSGKFWAVVLIVSLLGLAVQLRKKSRKLIK